MRRLIPPSLASALALSLLFGPSGLAAGPAADVVQGYFWPPSVQQGDSVSLFVSAVAPGTRLTVVRVGAGLDTVLQVDSLPGPTMQAIPDSAWLHGCDWDPAITFLVPDAWPSGMYRAELFLPPSFLRHAMLVVRENDPGSTARVLFQSSYTTWQAYNYFGGKSLYGFNSEGGRARRVSLRRPYAQYFGAGDFPVWEEDVIRWLEEEGYAVEYCTGWDLDDDPDLDGHYDVLLSVGHDEYWSREIRNVFERRVAEGRHVAYLGGNTCWWQVRFTPGRDVMICYKSKTEDPLTGVADSLVTVNWYDDPVFEPENPVTGLSWRNGGYVNSVGWYPASEGWGGYTALRTHHWIYDGTLATDGKEFGRFETIVGPEVDGCTVSWVDSLPYPTGADSTPTDFEILAWSPASQGFAFMGLFERNGGVFFNAGTNGWADGLVSDPTTEQITRNVLDRMLETSVAVGEGSGPAGESAGLRVRAFPNPANPRARVEWEAASGDGAGTGATRVTVHSLDGRRVAELAPRMGPAGGSAEWDGADAGGRPAATGLYFVRVETPAGATSAKLLLVR